MVSRSFRQAEVVGLIGGGLVVQDPAGESRLVLYNPFNRRVAILPHYPQASTKLYQELERAGCFDIRPSTYSEKSLTLAVTTKCNCRCIYCFEGGSGQAADMTWEVAQRIIDEYLADLPGQQRPVVAFYGGEPTQNMPVIQKCVAYVDSLGHKPSFSISTNGVMSDASLDYLLERRFYIALSADGPPDIQDHHRPLPHRRCSSLFIDRTLRAIVGSEIPFHVRATITSISVERMAECVRFFCDQGVRSIHMEPVEITGTCRGRPELRPSVEAFIRGFTEASAVAEDYGAILNTMVIRYLKCGITGPFCGTLAGCDKLYSAMGVRRYCHELMDNDWPDGLPFAELDATSRDSRSEWVAITDNPDSQCFSCVLKYVCGGSCPKQSWDETGTHIQPSSWHCDLSRRLIPILVAEIGRLTFDQGDDHERKT